MARKTKQKTIYECQTCGYQSPQWYGKCPNCGSWNQMEEITLTSMPQATTEPAGSTRHKPKPLAKIKAENEPRLVSDLGELNRVLGGGIVPGSLVLIGGDPGIGKSTLLLQLSAEMSAKGHRVLYVSGEESTHQIKLRAERLGVGTADFCVFAETDMEAVIAAITDLEPDFVVVDSIQTMTNAANGGAAGSVSQVREATNELMHVAKRLGVTIFIVGHVTKEGNIAGPRMLEHMVDTVLYFEGEKYNTFRILRAVKNRFGSTNEIGVFDMHEDGLVEVVNPSQLFIEERLAGNSGSAVVASLEGTRTLMTEIQALLTPTAFGNARRTASGLDYARVAVIMAVLEKRCGLMLQNQDAYLQSTGGVKLDEPAIDLAIAIAIASSYRDKETRPDDCFLGEIGLTGEIRRVSRVEERIAEAEKIGFTRIFIPNGNLSGLKHDGPIQIIGVKTLKQAVHLAFTDPA